MVAALSKASGRDGRGGLSAVLIVLAVVLFLILPARAYAQSTVITVDMTLCDAAAATCPATASLASVAVGQPVYYQVTIANVSGPGTTISLDDTLPSGFMLTGVVCAGVAQPLAPSVSSLALPAGTTVVCRFSGSFGAGSGTNAQNSAQVHDLATNAVESTSWQAAVDLATLPSDLSIAKSVAPVSIDLSTGPKQVAFTITVANIGQKDLYLRDLLTVQDQLRLMSQSVVLNVAFVSASCKVLTAAANASLPASDCLATAPIYASSSPPPFLVGSKAPADFVAWRYAQSAAGLLRAKDAIELTVTIELSTVSGADCILAPNSDGLINGASLVLTLPGQGGGPATALAESSANGANDNSAEASAGVRTGATVVNLHCNAAFGPKPKVLRVIKTQITPTPPDGIPWGSVVRYRITVQNISLGMIVNGVRVADWVQAGVGTPPFTATIVSATCPYLSWLNQCTNKVLSGPQTLQGYSDTKQLFGATLSGANGFVSPRTASFEIDVRYSNPQCDSYPDVVRKPILNVGMVTGWTQTAPGKAPEPVTETITAVAPTLMEKLPKCPLTVSKAIHKPSFQIRFGVPTTYVVTYANPDPDRSYTMGTMIDTMRAAAFPVGNTIPYALQLPVTYRYSCVVTLGSVTGYPPNNPSGPGGNDIALVTATQLPQQGVRLIQNTTPVVFGPKSSLVCTVVAIVDRPAETDPYCTTGMLENAAILDGSIFYNPNAAWPPSTLPGLWASVRTELPRCLSLVVNKWVEPGWTWQGGGPLTWKMTVLNKGTPLRPSETFTGIGPHISDTFTAGPPVSTVAVTAWTKACTPTPGCNVAWYPAPPANPSRLRLNELPTGESATATFTVQNAPAAVGANGEVCNTAQALMLGPPVLQIANDWYWKHPDPQSNRYTLRARACAKILPTGSVRIVKVVKNDTGSNSGIVVPANLGFDVTLHCTYPSDPTGVVIADAVRSPTASAPSLVEHIPVGSQCGVTEKSPQVPASTPKCVPEWQTSFSPAVTVPQAPAVPLVTVTNRLVCRPSTLVIVKTIDYYPSLAPPPPLVWFMVDCGSATQPKKVQVKTNGTPYSIVVPAPASCSVVEYVPPGNTGIGLYAVTQTPPGPVTTIVGAAVTVQFHNKLYWATWETQSRLLIRKLVLLNGASVPISPSLLPFAASFDVEIGCAGRPTVRVTLDGNPTPNGAIFERAVGPYPPGTQCAIREVERADPQPCSWPQPFTQPQNVTIGTSPIKVDILNAVTC